MADSESVFFLGTSLFALPSLKALLELGLRPIVITKCDQSRGRGKSPESTPVKKMALEEKLEVWEPKKLSESSVVSKIKETSPRLLVSVAYGEYIPETILKIPTFGCINVHPSLLPKYRGAAPVQRALMAGEIETGVTIAYVSAGWDTGDILLQRKFAIHAEENASNLLERLGQEGALLLKECVPQLFSNTLQAVSQCHQKATLAPLIRDQDVWLDWTKPAVQLVNQVRGLSQLPGARTHFGEKNLLMKILKARATEGINGTPGEIISLGKEGPIAATGKDGILLLEVQPENRKLLSGKDFVNGYRPQIGQKFQS